MVPASFRLRNYLWLLIAVVVLAGIAACQRPSPANQPAKSGDPIGKYKVSYEESDEIQARALALQVIEVDYNVDEGDYEIEFWFELWTGPTDPPERLGRMWCGMQDLKAGNLLIGIHDPATTTSQMGSTWKIAMENTQAEASHVKQQFLIPNHLQMQDGGVTASGTPPEADGKLELDKEESLYVWAAAPPMQPLGIQRQDFMVEKGNRVVYLKAKFSNKAS